MSQQPIFILGAPRSGTTFLASLLENTEYGSPFETHFITKYYKKLDSYDDLSNFESFKRLVSDILSERPVMQWDLNLDTKEFFERLSPDHSYQNICNQLCLLASNKYGHENWGDKTPHYVGDLDIIYKLFPDAKYIYIVRDGRDVALSLFEKPWGPANVYTAAKYWKDLNREHEAFQEIAQKNNIISLKYEDLLGDMVSHVRQIYQFLEMPFSADDEERFEKRAKKTNFDKWKTLMSPQQVKTFNNIAADTLRRFGYEAEHDEGPVPIHIKAFYEAHEFVFRWKHLFVANVIDTIKIKFFGKQPFAE